MKSDLLVCLEDISASQSVAPSVTSAVIDGAAIVQILKRGDVKTFQEYADRCLYHTYQESYEMCPTLMWYRTATKSIL